MAPKVRATAQAPQSTQEYTDTQLQEVLGRPSIGGIALRITGDRVIVGMRMTPLTGEDGKPLVTKGVSKDRQGNVLKDANGNPISKGNLTFASCGTINLSDLDDDNVVTIEGVRYSPRLMVSGYLVPEKAARVTQPARHIASSGMSLDQLMRLV